MKTAHNSTFFKILDQKKIDMIQVRLKQEVIELLKIPQYMAQLMIAIGSSEKNIKTWIRTNSDKITNYATLYAISKILEIPIEYLIDIECKRI